MINKQENKIQSNIGTDLLEYELNHYKNLYEQQRTKTNQLTKINHELINLKRCQNEEDQKEKLIIETYRKDKENDKVYWEEEIKRERKKISLAQKTIQILQDQIKVLRDEINHKNCKINDLRQHIDTIDPIKSNPLNNFHKQCIQQNKRDKQQYLNVIRTINAEKEQEKQMISRSFSELNEKYQKLASQYKDLQGKLNLQSELYKRYKQCCEIKLKNLNASNKDLNEEIVLLHNKIEGLSQKQQKSRKQVNLKWWFINEQLLKKVSELQQTIKRLDQEVQKMHHQIDKGNIKVIDLKEQNERLTKQMAWYLELIDQLKGNYIHSQLQKQNVVRKLQQEKKQVIKNSRITHRKQNSQHNKSICNQSRMTVYRLSVADKSPDRLETTIKTKKTKNLQGSQLKI